MEYAEYPAWHTSLIKQQITTSLEGIKRRAFQITASRQHSICCLFNSALHADRRDSMCSRLFRQPGSESHILHYLLPAKPDDELTDRLRTRNKYPPVRPGQTVIQKLFYPLRIVPVLQSRVTYVF